MSKQFQASAPLALSSTAKPDQVADPELILYETEGEGALVDWGKVAKRLTEKEGRKDAA